MAEKRFYDAETSCVEEGKQDIFLTRAITLAYPG